MSDVAIKPFANPPRAVIRPPGSKSLTNRALVMAAMVNGPCRLSSVLFADDTRVMLQSLSRLGFGIEMDEPGLAVNVRGGGGKIPAESAELFCGNSGTTIRFLTALCTLGRGNYLLDGIARMRQRPIGQLVDLLKNLGARISYLDKAGYPPVKVDADGLPGGLIRYPATVSSQFLSASLMVAPYARHEMRVDLEPNQTSWPYVWMTLRLMDQFGITPELLRDAGTGEPRQITVPTGQYSAREYAVEPDASNAAYFMGIAALHPGSRVTIAGLGASSLQGDVGFANVLRQMGATVAVEKESITIGGISKLAAVDVNLLDMPDQAQTLGVLALFATGRTIIRGLHTLRLKETDRLAALSTELRKFGAAVSVSGDDTLIIDPPTTVVPATVDTYDDHRMAMSFAMAGTRVGGVVIRDAQCVSKTYPGYFSDFISLGESS
jgi:3-phosphoshikimate 1-carboxyvinyltransferase